MLDLIFSWETLWWILVPVYLVASIGLILVVLLQKGKGVGFAGAFGVGPGSETLFGPRSARTLPQKLTYIGAALFMILALVLSMLSGKIGKGAAPDLVEKEAVTDSAALDQLFNEGEAAPAAPATATTVVTPAPAESAPAPAAPAPAAETPASAPAAPAPAAETPASAPAAPAPAAETPASAPAAPAPAAEAPAPAETPAAPAPAAPAQQ